MTEEQALALYREHCQPGDRGALERHGEKAAVAAIMAACALNRELTVSRLHDELGDAVDCTRVWSAWSYGTMGEDDFVPVSERIEEIADGLLAPIEAVEQGATA